MVEAAVPVSPPLLPSYATTGRAHMIYGHYSHVPIVLASKRPSSATQSTPESDVVAMHTTLRAVRQAHHPWYEVLCVRRQWVHAPCYEKFAATPPCGVGDARTLCLSLGSTNSTNVAQST